MTDNQKHSILIIGGTGSLGSQLSRYYYNKGWNVTIFSRDGHKQQALQRLIPNARFTLGDICNYDLVYQECIGQHYVVNAAAQKIVFQGEDNVDEFLRVNTIGAKVVADAAYSADVPVCLLISSDKAVNPVNLYGKTKAVAEDIYLHRGYYALRYGNVVNSRGSFMDIWTKLLIDKQNAVLRSPEPTRFFLKISDAIKLVDDALRIAEEPSVFVPRQLRSFSIYDIAYHLFGINNVSYTNLLPGEKQHEVLLADAEYGEFIENSHLLVRAIKGYNSESLVSRLDYSSSTADSMTAEEFMEAYYAK